MPTISGVELLVLMVPIVLGLLVVALRFGAFVRLVKLSRRRAEAQEETNRLLAELRGGAHRGRSVTP